MAEGVTPEVSQTLGSIGYGGNSNRVSTVGKMMMGPASKKSKKKAPDLAGNKRLPRPLRKGM